ncbi:DNA topoisomerase (ATP-hydrolyzing) subunit B [Candidatus Pacearchaeota archaeon]|nr:MAG: DNA topoisomerase (ATP-hydrolyzing) subunit B [Candidatus Pacearchaeota archaeon]
MAKEKSGKYGAESIKVLEGLEGVRHRPAMYIGSTSKQGLHHLVYEVVDNAVDEAMAGYCTQIDVVLNADGSVTVRDNGRGIPVEPHPVYKKPAVEIAVTRLHAGGKFEKGSYMVSGGLHGVGISVVAALSTHMKIRVKRNGKIYQQEYKIGKPLYDLKVVGKVDEKDTGTEVTFTPDASIFSTTKFDFSILATRLREIAFLNKGLRITLTDERPNGSASVEEKNGKKKKKEVFHYDGGIVEFVKWVNQNKETLHKPIYYTKTDSGVVVEVAVQYNTGYQENILGFVNTINTIEGGTHVVGFKSALTRSINDYASKNKLSKNGNFTGDDVREGLTAIVSVKVPEPQFEGQTKTKLGNSEVKGIVESISYIALSEFFEENPAVAKKIVNKALEAQKARSAAKKAKELVRRKSAFGSGGLPGKLADCSRKHSADAELFIVEGDSAGGSAKQARNKEYQAILPLKGKILNVEKANPVKTLSNEEISSLITAIGTGIGEQFDISKIRYSRIIIMTDADVDGSHITTLLLTFFFRMMPQLIENGNVFIAVPPLYRVRHGNKVEYIYSDAELKKYLDKVKTQNVVIQRFKGLGEMNPEQLWETTMNPKTRVLRRITIEDAVAADETFSKLMGDNVLARRQFISEKAQEAVVDI